jgi:hypothetical protein
MFEAEYIRLVIKPRVDAILEDGVSSIADLVSKFNKAHECLVSKTKMIGWLKSLDYRVTKTVKIDGPFVRMNRMPVPEPKPRIEETFKTQHTQIPMNFMPPTGGVFSNVRMPGFEE